MAMGKGAQAPDNSALIQSLATQSAQTSMHNSDNQLHLGMAKIGSDVMQSSQMSMLANRALSAEVNQTEDQIEARVDIARMNYNLTREQIEKTHSENEDALRIKEIEVRRGPAIDSSTFLS